MQYPYTISKSEHLPTFHLQTRASSPRHPPTIPVPIHNPSTLPLLTPSPYQTHCTQKVKLAVGDVGCRAPEQLSPNMEGFFFLGVVFFFFFCSSFSHAGRSLRALLSRCLGQTTTAQPRFPAAASNPRTAPSGGSPSPGTVQLSSILALVQSHQSGVWTSAGPVPVS